jgi:hypothetical protein
MKLAKKIENILKMAEVNNQKPFLYSLEQVMGVKKPIFIDRNTILWAQYLKMTGGDTAIWAINDENLSRVSELKNDYIVGRYKLNLENSEVQELVYDIESNINPTSQIQVNDHFKELREATMQVIRTLLDFGIPQDCIYVKASGKGMHVQTFIKGLTEQQFKTLSDCLLEKIKLPNVKSSECPSDKIVFGLDTSTTTKSVMKLREYGGIHDKLGQYHYCTNVDITKLPKMKTYPFNLNPKEIVYPALKICMFNEEQINKLNEINIQQLTKELVNDEPINYDRLGNPDDLQKCPLVAYLIEKSKQPHPDARHNLNNNDRIFLSHLYTFFGKAGEQQLHKILENCKDDYKYKLTQYQIESLKRNNHKPITCQWAIREIKNPVCQTCTVRVKNTPLNLAVKKVSLEQVKATYLKWFDFTNERDIIDTDIIDLTLAAVADRYVPGFEKFWLFLVARSGGIKTQILRGVSTLPNVYTIDSLTSKTLISGIMENTPHGRKAVGGIMKHLDQKCLVIKDFTLILSLNAEERNAIFSDLRNAYDGYLEKAYGTHDQKITADAHFGLVAACTPVIDNYWQLNNLMGDRFLKIRHEIKDRKAIEKAICEEGRESKAQEEIQSAVKNYFESLDLTREVKVPEWIDKIIIEAVTYTAHMRTALMTTGKSEGENYNFAGSMEYATRLAKQAKRLIKLLTLIRDKPEPTLTEVATMLRVLIDTPPLYRSKLIPYIMNNGSITVNKAADLMRSHAETADRVMRELYYVQILQPDGMDKWTFSSHFKNVIDSLIDAIAKGTSTSHEEAKSFFMYLFAQQPAEVEAAIKDRVNKTLPYKENKLLQAMKPT